MKNDKIKKGLQKFSGSIVKEIEAKYLEKKRNQKCLCDYCDGSLQSEYWDTDGIEYEQYLCDECGALHEVPITRNDKGYNDCVDIDRHWDDLEMIDEDYGDEEDGECCNTCGETATIELKGWCPSLWVCDDAECSKQILINEMGE
jgi:hypothetical protein